MKGMQKIVHGSGFKGVLRYASERDSPDTEPGKLLGGNMSGYTVTDLAREFGAIRGIRPDIKKPVWHQSLRLPKGDRLDADEWVKFADDYMQRMGFTDKHARTYWLHNDSDGQHIHIVACRVATDGSVHDSSHQSMKSTPILGQMEREYGLTLTPGPEIDENGNVVMPNKKKPKKNEIEQALRTGEEPPKQRLQRLIDEAKADRPTAVQFVERLESAGVTAVANLASTGKMNGFSFEIEGIPFKGSQLGKAYAWGALSKEIDYEQARDSEKLGQYTAAARSREISSGLAANNREDAAPSADAAVARRPGVTVGAIGPSVGQPDGRITSRDPEGRASSDQGREAPGTSSSEASGNNQSAGSNIPAVAGIQPGSGEGQAPQPLASRFVFKPSDSGAFQRVVDLAGALVKNPGQQAKLDAWRQQHATLQAPAYRLTLTARRDNLKTYNMGKGKGDGGGEKTYTAQEIAALIPSLSRQNARGYDIYITPIDPHHHYLVVDDMTPAGVERLIKSGYAPTLVQTSSEGNRQAIIKAPKDASFGIEQKVANKLVQYLNQELGDPAFSGVVHPFRLAGFSNKKPGRNDFFTRILQGGHRLCGRAAQALQEMREAVRERLKSDSKHKADSVQKVRAEALYAPADNALDVACKGAYRDVLDRVRGAGWTLDMSRVDYQVAQVLLDSGLQCNEVETLIAQHSPGLHERHSNPADYARRTVEAAEQAQRSDDSARSDFAETDAQRSMYERPRG